MNTNINDMKDFLCKWQRNLKLQDWDIQIQTVEKQWRKTGDIKIDEDNRTAILLINIFNPKQTNLEELIIHELLHLKLWAMDQMIERLINCLYVCNEEDPKRALVYGQFMHILESTVHDLTKSFLEQGGINKNISFGRLENQIKNELGNNQKDN